MVSREEEMTEARGRRCREVSSPDTAKVCAQARMVRPTFRKVQVVYYLSRNGQLEHPHYIEVAHLANHRLRLRDVLDRLTILRGKGMPSLYAWSCKRSYKNGYVWNDLAENDVIYPSDGAEYVLKGSELIEGCTESFRRLHVGNAQEFQFGNVQEAQDARNLHPKRKPIAIKRHPQPEEVDNNNQYEEEDEENEEEVEEEEEEEYEEKTSYTTSTTPHSRCSRGVSTNELERQQQSIVTQKNPSSDLTQPNSSPPSTTSSTLSNKDDNTKNTTQRFEDGDPVPTDSLLSRNSVLFQLISCGGAMPFRGTRNMSIVKQNPQTPPPALGTRARKSISSSNLHKGVLCKAAVAAKLVAGEADEIICMSENPRFGNLHIEEKEYFSGSIVESMAKEERVQIEPALKKSSSYSEERSSKAAVEESAEDEVKREKSVRAKCIPRKKCNK